MAESELVVRPAVLEDAPALALVHTRSWQEGYEHVFGRERLATIDVEERAALWRQILARESAEEANLVCLRGSEPVGFVSTGPSRDTDGRAADGELYGIYVLPDAWGSGVGRALQAAAFEALQASGFRTATLWVLEDNPRARRFYEAGGWVANGLRRQGTHLGVTTTEVRYRIGLEGAT